MLLTKGNPSVVPFVQSGLIRWRGGAFKGDIPVESDHFRIKAPNGSDCGEASLKIYRQDGTRIAGILVFSYHGYSQPMGSGGEPLSKNGESDDAETVQELEQSNAALDLYKHLGSQQRAFLSDAVPTCE